MQYARNIYNSPMTVKYVHASYLKKRRNLTGLTIKNYFLHIYHYAYIHFKFM